MAELVGVEKSKAAVVSVAKIASLVSQCLHGGGWLLALMPLLSEAKDLGATDLRAVKAEVLDLSKPESVELKQAFKDNLKLINSSVEVKVEDAIDLVSDVADLVADAVNVGEAYFSRGKVLVGRAKALFS